MIPLFILIALFFPTTFAQTIPTKPILVKPAPTKPTPVKPAPVKPVVAPNKPFPTPSQPAPKPTTAYYVTTDVGVYNTTAAAYNPLKGFASWEAASVATLPFSLEFYSVKLNQVMTGNNTFDWSTYLEPTLSAAANRGKHAILRFVLDSPGEPTGVPQYLIDAGLKFNFYTAYGGGQSPYYNDTNLLYALKTFIGALGAKYDNDNRIGFLQVGLLGFWGEWHTYTNKDEGWIPAKTKDLVVSWFSSAFKNTQIQLRVPWSSALSLPKFGLHDDSFAYSTLDGAANGGVAVSWFFWPTVISASYTNFWKNGTMGGELSPSYQASIFSSSYPAGTSYHQDFFLCANTTHATYMLNDYAFSTGYTGNDLAKAKLASNSMGYSFQVTKVVAFVSSSLTVNVTVEITQRGNAPFYYPLSLVLTCNNGSETYTKTGLETALINTGAAANFTVSVANSNLCLNNISITLSSSRLVQGQTIKFAQGTNGVVVVSIPALPAPTTMTPVKPAPTKPTTLKPASTTPNPVKPVPTTPTPVKPAPTKLATLKPASTKPTPVKPLPNTPTPVKPAPATPTPVKPAPVKPLVAPNKPFPTPSQPAIKPTISYYVTTDVGVYNATAAAYNPLKGFASWEAASVATLSCSLEFYIVKLKQVMTGNNTFDWSTYLEPTLSAAANRGKHAILRFVLDSPGEPTGVPQYLIDAGLKFNFYTAYGGGQSPYYNDTNLLYALQTFIGALGAKYDNDNRIGFLQVGLLGFWGEWHTYTNKDEGWIPATTKDLVVSWFSSAFKNTQIQLRVPWSSALSLPKFGLHDDSFAYSTLDGAANGGVAVSWFFWPTVISASYTNFWKNGTMGGELLPSYQASIFSSSYPAGTSYHQDFFLCANTTHATYMLNAYAFSTGYTGNDLAKAKLASNNMGYSFQVTKVVAFVASSLTANVTVEITQRGNAPFYYPLSLVLTCNNGSETYTKTGLETALINTGAAANFTVSVANSNLCLNNISITLSSSRLVQGQTIKFAQGTNGVVVVSIPAL